MSDEPLHPTESEMLAAQVAGIIMARWFPALRGEFDVAGLPLKAAVITVEFTMTDDPKPLRTAISWPMGEFAGAAELAGEAKVIFAQQAAVKDAPNKGQG